MITDPQYQAWLENPQANKVLLVVATAKSGGSTVTRRMATTGITIGGDFFDGILKSNFSINESIGLDYTSSISYGDIEIINFNGERDSWLNDIWVNKSISIYFGDMSWTDLNNDFRLIFNGIIGDIDSRDRSVLNLKIRDKLQKLNTPITESVLGNWWHGAIVGLGTYVNANRESIKPLVFGEVFNITPLLTDPTELEYMANDGAVEQIIEVRDNGIPVSFNDNADNAAIPVGSFRLLNSPAGTITASVQGIKKSVNLSTGTTSTSTYVNTVAGLIASILVFYGKTLTTAELDLGASSSFNTLGTEYAGVYLSDRTNVFVLCQELAKSAGLTLASGRDGIIKLVPITIPGSASISITDSDIFLNSMRVALKPAIVGAVKIGYAKNWTVQSGIITAIPEEHKNLFATQWREAPQNDATTVSDYGLDTQAPLTETYLIDKTNAETIGLSKLNTFKTPRKVISMTCTAKFLQTEVGDAVQLTSSRFGLSSTYGRVISANPMWMQNKIELEVLV